MRRPLTTGVCVLAVAAAAAVSPAAGATDPAPATGLVSCASLAHAHAHARVVYRSGVVVVRRAAVAGHPGTHDWACTTGADPSRDAEQLGTGPQNAPRDLRITRFVAAGPWLVSLESSRRGWTACFRTSHVAGGCPAWHHQLELSDLPLGSSSSNPVGPDVGTILLSSMHLRDGDWVAGLAWLEPAAGRHRFRLETTDERDSAGSGASIGGGFTAGGPVGAIDPRSLRLHGLTVSYVENGTRRSLDFGAGLLG